MVKLKDLLKEAWNDSKDEFIYSFDDVRAYSWLNPNGVFIPVKHSHDEDARNFLWKASKNQNDFDDDANHVMTLWNLGWQRITSSEFLKKLYCHNEKSLPTQRQLKALIDLAIEIGAEEIETDSEKVLWSSNDSLEETA